MLCTVTRGCDIIYDVCHKQVLLFNRRRAHPNHVVEAMRAGGSSKRADDQWTMFSFQHALLFQHLTSLTPQRINFD